MTTFARVDGVPGVGRWDLPRHTATRCSVAQFRKKPVVIEARQLGRGYDEDVEIMRWCHGDPIGDEERGEDSDLLFRIRTLEGFLLARCDDWIIRGVHGEFYPCKPDIFAATYEEVAS